MLAIFNETFSLIFKHRVLSVNTIRCKKVAKIKSLERLYVPWKIFVNFSSSQNWVWCLKWKLLELCLLLLSDEAPNVCKQTLDFLYIHFLLHRRLQRIRYNQVGSRRLLQVRERLLTMPLPQNHCHWNQGSSHRCPSELQQSKYDLLMYCNIFQGSNQRCCCLLLFLMLSETNCVIRFSLRSGFSSFTYITLAYLLFYKYKKVFEN